MSTEVLNLDSLFISASLLAENASVILEDLDKNSAIYKAYQEVLYAYTALHNTDPEIIYNILERLPKPTSIVEQSAGAFLFSKYYACYNMKTTGTKHCTPIMINNTTNRQPRMFKSKSGDDDQFWILKGNSLIYLSNNSNTNVAKIFLETESVGLREKHIKSLKEHNIEYVKLLMYEKESHKIIQDITHIDDIIILDEDDVYLRDNDHHNNSANNGVIGWLIVALIIVLIIIAILFYFRRDVFVKTSPDL